MSRPIESHLNTLNPTPDLECYLTIPIQYYTGKLTNQLTSLGYIRWHDRCNSENMTYYNDFVISNLYKKEELIEVEQKRIAQFFQNYFPDCPYQLHFEEGVIDLIEKTEFINL